MMMLIFIAAAFPAAILQITRNGVARASKGEEHLAFLPAIFWVQAAGLIPVAMFWAGLDLLSSIILSAFFATLAAGAWCDRETAWAPDATILAATILSAMTGSVSGAWEIGLIEAAAVGLSLFLAVQLAWVVLAYLTAAAGHFPPGDIMALLMAVLAFGPGAGIVAWSFSLVAVLIVLKHCPPLRRLFSKDEIAGAGMNGPDHKDSENGKSLTFLCVAFPHILILTIVLFW